MTLPSKTWDKFVNLLRKIDDTAANLMTTYLQDHALATDADVTAAIDYAYALATKYGEAAGAVAAQMYDLIASAQRATVPAAVPAETATYGEVAGAVRGSLEQSILPDNVGAAVGRLVKLAAADTMLHNSARDHAEFAWIPRGATCAFCLTLASNGWRRIDPKAKGSHASHIHANCDCMYAVRFSDDMDVQGYNNGAEYREMYENAEGRGAHKINSMRRELYAENRDKINAQKRAAYERRKEAESST